MPPIRFRIRTIMIAIAALAVLMGARLLLNMVVSPPQSSCRSLLSRPVFLSSEIVRSLHGLFLAWPNATVAILEEGQSSVPETGTGSKRGARESVG